MTAYPAGFDQFEYKANTEFDLATRQPSTVSHLSSCSTSVNNNDTGKIKQQRYGHTEAVYSINAQKTPNLNHINCYEVLPAMR